jgi:membrane-associated phospholipid phosphatase
MFFKKLKGKETMMFYIGFSWTLLMMFSRMLVGAHFLTDTCMGALIVVVVVYIGHEIATRKGLIYKDEYHPQQQEAVQQ